MVVLMNSLKTVLAGLIFFFSALSAMASDRSIGGKSYEIIGTTISKSASVQLADLSDDNHDVLNQAIYVPAGTPLLLLKRPATDPSGRRLTMAITGFGLLVYPRIDGVHYFKIDAISQLLRENAAIAFAKSKVELDTRNYDRITITPTEFYKVKTENDRVEILIGKEKMGVSYTKDEYVEIDPEMFSIVDQAMIEPDRIPNPFQRYDVLTELGEILKDAVGAGVNESQRQQFLANLQSGRLVTSKECGQEVSMKAEADAGLGFDSEKFFSPIKAKLGISGAYSQNTILPKGTTISVSRYSRGGTDPIIELRWDQIFEEGNCAKSLERQRLQIAETQGRNALIDSKTPIPDMRLGANLLPEYSCRVEYERLIDYLTRQETLSVEVAHLVIARFVRFRGPKNPSDCAN